MKFTNPIISGFYPDPSICFVGEDYYLVTSTFEYFPGVPIFHSKDLVHWRQIGHCLTSEEQLPLSNAWRSGGIYAPTLRYHEGTFYMVTTNVSGGGNFYVTASNPAGPWSLPIPVAQEGIDPSLLFDDDGRVYFQCARNGDEGEGIYQCEIDIATGALRSDAKMIWKGTGGACPEAPHLYKINEQYYLMIAEGGTEYGHMETIARSKSPFGPYEPCPYNPILSNRSMSSKIHATGHADLIQVQDGTWWAVCLGIRPASYPMAHHLGREVFLAPVTWTQDGWPIIGNDTHIEVEMDAPHLPQVEWEAQPIRDEFNDSTLALDWVFLRNPKPRSWALDERSGYLTLHGHTHTLSDELGAPAFVGRRLSHFTSRIETKLEYEPLHDGEEAGITTFMNEKHHYDLGVTSVAGNKKIVFRKTVGSLQVEEFHDYPEGAIQLQVKTEPQRLTFSIKSEQGEYTQIGWGETHFLSTEVAGGFTGVFAAMYATSPVEPATPALFDWFDYEPMED